MTGAEERADASPPGLDRRPLRMLVLEPYYGGSHRAVLDGLLARLDVEADLLTLPARKWKWRMRGAAINMAAEVRRLAAERGAGQSWDLIFASTFVNLAEFYGLAGDVVAGVPSVLYFHENQLVYPNRNIEEWDFQFPLTNITSALTATSCVFNSEFTRDTFVAEIPGFMKRFPDHVPKGLAPLIEGRSEVIAPPFDSTALDQATLTRGDAPRIVWPHRWEHDKNPEPFFAAVTQLAEEGIVFEVAVAGQAFQDRPAVIERAAAKLGDRLVHLGEPDGRDGYARLLCSSDIAVSTATNEFFGLAMIEAAYAGCYPLVPERLVYPEIYTSEFLYADDAQLVAQLRALVVERPSPGAATELATPYTFGALTPRFAQHFENVARNGIVSP